MRFSTNRWVNGIGWLGLFGLAVSTVFVTQRMIAEPEPTQASPAPRVVDSEPEGEIIYGGVVPNRPEPVHPDLDPIPVRGQPYRGGKDFDVWFQSVGFDPQSMTVGFRADFAGWTVVDGLYKFTVSVADSTNGSGENAPTVYENHHASPIRPLPSHQLVRDSLLHQFPVQPGHTYLIAVDVECDLMTGDKNLADVRQSLVDLSQRPAIKRAHHFVTVPGNPNVR